MKTTITAILMLSIFTLHAYGQHNYTEERDYYLQKSQKQKKTSLILGIAGGAVFSAGLIIYFAEGNNDHNANYSTQSSNTGQNIAYAGGAIMIAAIPFQIASGNNKKKAMSVGLSDMRLPALHQNNLVKTFTPSVSLKIGL